MAGGGPRALLVDRPLPAVSSGSVLLVVAWCLLALGDSAREGEFTSWGLAGIVVGLLLAAAVVAIRLPVATPGRRLLAVPVAVSVAAAAFHPVDRYMHATGRGLHAIQLLALATAAAAAVTLLVPSTTRRGPRRGWYAVAALAVATGITTVVVASDPGIDVWYLLQQSSTGLLHGDDLYRQHWAHSTGLQDVYPYLPGTTLLLAPFRWLLGDVRYGLLGALLLTSWLLRRLAPAAPAALAALVLVAPHFAFLVDQSWTEPLLLAALAGAVLALREDRPWLAVVGLAVAMACKQHIVLLLPLFAAWPAFGVRRTLVAGGAALAVTLPWLVAGPRDLLHDAVHANLDLGVLQRANCLPSLFDRHGVTVGFWFLLLVLAAAYAVVLRRAPRTPAGLALSCAVVMWALDVANKQSFFNHYQLPLGLLLVSLAAAEPA